MQVFGLAGSSCR